MEQLDSNKMELTHTEKIEIVINFYGEKHKDKKGGTIEAVEKIVYNDGELLYKEYMTTRYSLYGETPSSTLNKFISQLYKSAYQSESSKDSRSNTSHPICSFKMLWFKFLSKVFRLKK